MFLSVKFAHNKIMLYLCTVFFMVLDFKVNEKSRRDDDSFCFSHQRLAIRLRRVNGVTPN